jgi:hypothetical protein
MNAFVRSIVLAGIFAALPLAAEAIARQLVTERGPPEDFALLSDALMEQGRLGEAVAAIAATGLAPLNDRESAVLLTGQPGAYTMIVRGKGTATGVALVETYLARP